MATITPAFGTGEYLEINAAVMKGASFERDQSVNMLPFPTSGMTANADGVYETPHGGTLNVTRITIRGPFDQAAPFYAAPYNLRKGVTVTARFGMTAAMVTPAAEYKVANTRDMNDVQRLGEWEAVLVPADDGGIGYFTGVA